MNPYYTPHHKKCEWCDDDIYIGYECLMTKDGFFCDKSCLKNHLYEGEQVSHIFLVGNRKEWNI